MRKGWNPSKGIFTGCLQKTHEKKKSKKSTRLVRVETAADILGFHLGGGDGGLATVFCSTDSQYENGRMLSLDLCMFPPHMNLVHNWQTLGVKY